jgi:hypothetical protein
MKVRVNVVYVYHPNGLDRVDGRTDLKSGELVRVVNLPGCPKANTMGHCYVIRTDGTGIHGWKNAAGLVCCNSLHTKTDYCEYLKGEINRIESERAK